MDSGVGEAETDVKTWRSSCVHMQSGRQTGQTHAGPITKTGDQRQARYRERSFTNAAVTLSKGQGMQYSLTGEASLTRLHLVKDDKRVMCL